MDGSNWVEYKSMSGQTLFFYNKSTGEHKWPLDSPLERAFLMTGQPTTTKEVCTTGTQTEDDGCQNGCNSIYVNTHQLNIQALIVKRTDMEMKDSTQCDDGSLDDKAYTDEITSVLKVLDESSPTVVNGQYNAANYESRLNQDYENRQFECHVCNKRSTSKNNLKVHMRTHTGEKPFECCECNKRFSSKQVLNEHIKMHTGEKPFNCIICGSKFARKKYLIRHTRVHTGERPFQCQYCEKRFTVKKSLTDHTRIHTGERPFKCDECKKTFQQRGHLSEHLKRHTGEKPFGCTMCKKKYTRKANLVSHMEGHSKDNIKAQSPKDEEGEINNVEKNSKEESTGTPNKGSMKTNQGDTETTSKGETIELKV